MCQNKYFLIKTEFSEFAVFEVENFKDFVNTSFIGEITWKNCFERNLPNLEIGNIYSVFGTYNYVEVKEIFNK